VISYRIVLYCILGQFRVGKGAATVYKTASAGTELCRTARNDAYEALNAGQP